MLIKSVPIKLKAGPDDGMPDGTFTAYAAVFNNVDSVGDVIYPGAFEKTLVAWAKSNNPIPLLFGHDMSDPFSNLGHVSAAEEDAAGLKVTGHLDLDNAKSLQVYRMLKGRRINNLSFAYDEVDSGPVVQDGQDAWGLKELKLYEVSICQVGANQATEILSVKGIPNVAARALRDMKAGRVLSAKNEDELRTAHDALGRVLSALDAPEKSKGFTANPLRPPLLLESDIKNVGEDASGTSPSCHAPADPVSRGASSNPSATTAKVRQTLLDIQLLEGEVA